MKTFNQIMKTHLESDLYIQVNKAIQLRTESELYKDFTTQEILQDVSFFLTYFLDTDCSTALSIIEKYKD